MYSMRSNEQRIDTNLFDRLANMSKPYLAYAERRNFAINTKVKYNHYEREGKSIFAVTLSTYVSNEKFAKSDKMRKFWVHEFLYRVTEHLPYKLKEMVDYDYVIERSPEGHYHYHGLLAMPREAGDKIWKNDALSKDLARDLAALRTKGQHRAFAVNSFVVEPIRPGLTVDHWIHYMTQTPDYIPSSDW